MNDHDAFLRLIEVSNQLGWFEALKILEGVKGPEQGLVAQAAERAERQGAAEDSRERGRVAPVKDLAALTTLAEFLGVEAADSEATVVRCNETGEIEEARQFWREAAMYREWERAVLALLTEPESGADAPASPPSLETPTEANP